MNSKTILGKIKRCEPLSEKEVEYCRKWYANLIEESAKQEVLAERRSQARSDLEILCRMGGTIAEKSALFAKRYGREPFTNPQTGKPQEIKK